jgi:hypothetical protein
MIRLKLKKVTAVEWVVDRTEKPPEKIVTGTTSEVKYCFVKT